MGKREVVMYICDGCKTSTTAGPGETVRGFTRIILAGNREAWLCTVCYGAVEWVAKFQGITCPPKVYGPGTSARLRKPVKS